MQKISRVLMVLAAIVAVTHCDAQTILEPNAKQTKSLRTFLQKYLGEPYPPFEREGQTRFSAAFVDLNDDQIPEAIVYVTGRSSCGTGGCTMLILAPEGTSYRVITNTTITQLPIRILNTKTNGWRDIVVVVAGGGIQPGYESQLSFDGKTYPSNPSVPPARQLQGQVRGKIVISDKTKNEILYPDEKVLGQLPEGSEAIVPGESIGKLRLGMRKDDLQLSWQSKPDSIVAHQDSCRATEVLWFDSESRWHIPGVRAYVADDRVYEITSEWDKRFKMQEMGIVFGKTLQDLQASMPDGTLLQLKGSAAERPGGADELFWVDSRRGIAFGLEYPRGSTPQNRLNRVHPLHRIVDSVTVFRPQDGFQPHGCLKPDQPLVSAEASAI